MEPLNKEKIIEKIKDLQFQCDGSGVGKLYQDIPFKEFNDFNKLYVQRSQNYKRLNLFNDIDLNNKVILDIGCNIGYFSFKLADQGAVCHGVDYDSDNIQVAQMLKKYKKLKNVHFYNSKFNDDFVDEILSKGIKFDIILLFSVIHWLMNDEHNIEKIISLLRRLHNHTQIIFYEPSSAIHAFFPQLTQKKEIKEFLFKIGCTYYKRTQKFYVSNIGTNRENWIGKIELEKIIKKIYVQKKLEENKNLKLFYTHRNYFFKIIRLKENPRLFLIKNEIELSELLKTKDYTPYFYGTVEYKDYLFLIYENLDLIPLSNYILKPSLIFKNFKTKIPQLEKKLYHILNDLRSEKILHRDLIPNNILINKDISKIKIIDFEFSCRDLNEISFLNNSEKKYFKIYYKFLCTPYYRAPNFDILSYDIDEYAIKNVLFFLKKYHYYSFLKKILRIIYRRLYNYYMRYKEFFDNLGNKILNNIPFFTTKLGLRIKNLLLIRLKELI